jgi:hypothetical protein
MCAWIVTPRQGLIEPSLAPEFYVDGAGAIERIGDSLRFYLCAEQMPLEAGSNEPQHIVMCKIVRPLRGLNLTAIQLMQCLDTGHVEEARRPPLRPRLV